MNSRERVGANLDAGPLAAYAFAVAATVGHRDMRYSFARARKPESSLTVVYIDVPSTLCGTEIAIWEHFGGVYRIRTYIPTMRTPRDIGAPQVFDTLPLTDISYLDLMRGLSPSVLPEPTMTAARSSYVDATAVYRMDGLTVTEQYADVSTTPISRIVERSGMFERAWHVVDIGTAGDHRVPLRVQVTRADTPKATVFERVTPVLALDTNPGVASSERLMQCAVDQLARTR
ncbi:hypothetical protein ABZ942_41605 [Nocardia sp. NPDC046473]|uniref:hypothetical protein n=1 Tax=Nocardia sp. NPDC046473 TaxID=3155733 RepID=UPI0033F0748D